MKWLSTIIAFAAMVSATPAISQTVFDAAVAEPDQTTADVSTNELRQVINAGNTALLDARPPMEYAVSHIPGALNVAPQPGRPAHLYVSDVAEVGRLLNGRGSIADTLL